MLISPLIYHRNRDKLPTDEEEISANINMVAQNYAKNKIDGIRKKCGSLREKIVFQRRHTLRIKKGRLKFLEYKIR